MKVKNFMTKKVLTVNKDMSVKEFIRIMEENNITGAPVVDENEKVIGVISVTDVIKRSNYVNKELAHCEDCYEVNPTTGIVEIHKYYTEELFEKSIENLMTRKLISITPEADLVKAVDIFLSTPVHRILVMENDKIEGIISTKDTLKAYQKLKKGIE